MSLARGFLPTPARRERPVFFYSSGPQCWCSVLTLFCCVTLPAADCTDWVGMVLIRLVLNRKTVVQQDRVKALIIIIIIIIIKMKADTSRALPWRRDQAADGWTAGDADDRSMSAVYCKNIKTLLGVKISCVCLWFVSCFYVACACVLVIILNYMCCIGLCSNCFRYWVAISGAFALR